MDNLQELEPSDPQVSDDPLNIKDLCLKYDYLMFKIKDHIQGLSESTYDALLHKKSLIDTFLTDELAIDQEMAHADELLAQCDTVEAQFMKLDQISEFVSEFKIRVLALEESVASLR